ncbi:MAG: hypothetical protein U0Q03_01570 [Acidimicrobiales bacterium]
MRPVRRDADDELCGHVVERDGTWRSLTVFGATLGEHDDEHAAVNHVLEHGLSSLAERWTLETAGEEPEIVCIQEANEHGVTVALGYYSMPGVPTLRITRAELDSGTRTLTR